MKCSRVCEAGAPELSNAKLSTSEGLGRYSHTASSTGCTPTFFNAEPHKMGVKVRFRVHLKMSTYTYTFKPFIRSFTEQLIPRKNMHSEAPVHDSVNKYHFFKFQFYFWRSSIGACQSGVTVKRFKQKVFHNTSSMKRQIPNLWK